MPRPLIIVGEKALANARRQIENFDVRTAKTCSEMRDLLANTPTPSLILSDVSLADGNWCDVLRAVVEHGVSAEVQILARAADAKFRLEVAARGGRCVEALELRPETASAPPSFFFPALA